MTHCDQISGEQTSVSNLFQSKHAFWTDVCEKIFFLKLPTSLKFFLEKTEVYMTGV